MRVLPFGGSFLGIATALLGSGRRARPPGSRYVSRYPKLNRSERHPRASTYREAANISTRLGVRTGPLR